MFTAITSPPFPRARSSNVFSCKFNPSERICVMKRSNRTIVWSFQRAGPPGVECRIRRRWFTHKLYDRAVRLDFGPRWLFFKLYSHLSVVIWVASEDPTQPGNPASANSLMCVLASSKLSGVRTYFSYSTVLPNSTKWRKKVLCTSLLMAVFSSMSSNVKPRPRYRSEPSTNNSIGDDCLLFGL